MESARWMALHNQEQHGMLTLRNATGPTTVLSHQDKTKNNKAKLYVLLLTAQKILDLKHNDLNTRTKTMQRQQFH